MVQADQVVSIQAIADEIRRSHFASVGAEQMRPLLPQAVAGWKGFAASWDDLGLDTFMADGGRYRRRRFGAFSLSAGACCAKRINRTIKAATTTR